MTTLSIKIENIYEDGDKVIVTQDIDVPAPPNHDFDSEDHEDWAYDNLHSLTGTGRYAGNDAGETRTPDAAYFVEVLASEDPALVGHTYEWGI